MKLIDMSCPHCSSQLKVDAEKRVAKCEHCGATILIDDEVRKISYDNAEEAGYNFEKGRQRAQRENMFEIQHTLGSAVSENNSFDETHDNGNEPPKKRKTWLWVLGWIFCFPIPLGILVWRKENIKKPIKIAIIAISAIVYFILFAGGEATNSTKSSDVKQDKEFETVIYADDKLVNQFINEYNSVSKYPMDNIEAGNIRTKYYGVSNGIQIKMINAMDAGAEAFSISIYGGNTEEKDAAMFTVFTQVVNTVDPSISNEEIESFIQKLKDSKLVEDVAFGDNMKVSYVPMTFREDGSWLCDGRIDIYAPNYGK